MNIPIDQCTKSGTSLKRGEKENSQTLQIKSVDRSVMIQLKWENNLEVKRDLTELVCSCFLTDERGNLFEISVIIRSGKNTWRVTKKDCYGKIDFSQLINTNTFYGNLEKRNI